MSVTAFLRSLQVAGLTTLTAMLLALVLDHSPADNWYVQVHHLPVIMQVGTFIIDKPLNLWINDGRCVVVGGTQTFRDGWSLSLNATRETCLD